MLAPNITLDRDLATDMYIHELETVAQVSAIIASILDEDELLNQVEEVTRTRFPDYCIHLYLVEGDMLVRIKPQQKAKTPAEIRTYYLPLNHNASMMVEAVHTRRSLVVGDITRTPGYLFTPLMIGARSEMAIPLIAGDNLIGVLDVESCEEDRFSSADVSVMQTLADMVAVAIQNARFHKQAKQLAIAEERNRLARELHDSVSQALYGIVLGATTIKTMVAIGQNTQAKSACEYVLSLANAGLEEIRASIFDLRSDELATQGLAKALQSQVKNLSLRHGIDVDAMICEEPNLPIEQKEALYRVVREALHNIMKHAQATHVLLHMDCAPGAIHVAIEDNGIGFDPSLPYEGHLGLKSMQERVAMLHGVMAIESHPGQGSTITITIPV